jgi:hypothetical protein
MPWNPKFALGKRKGEYFGKVQLRSPASYPPPFPKLPEEMLYQNKAYIPLVSMYPRCPCCRYTQVFCCLYENCGRRYLVPRSQLLPRANPAPFPLYSWLKLDPNVLWLALSRLVGRSVVPTQCGRRPEAATAWQMP